ncbi:hypothetical protein [Dryocola sp. BD626]|uniref:hypothetical protein n=1 Tax=Dryocola sp. BD626 TaxID=3133273 RepID=UPI003F5063CC
MNFLRNHKELFVSLLCAALPLIAILFPSIREYVIGNYYVSATYNTAIIFVYLVGCFLVFFSFLELTKCTVILQQKNSSNPAPLLGDANKIVFSPNHGQSDDTLASLYESMKESVNRKQQHRLSAIQNCANISTMIGLLGTFAGLSITIASVITLLERSQISGNTNDADMLGVIVNVVSSLSEPLKGMNTAFVSSIYGVVSAILLGIMCSFLRSSFNKLSVTLRDANLDFLREVKTRQVDGKVRILQIETVVDELVREMKTDLTAFHQSTLALQQEKRGLLVLLIEKMDESHQRRAAFEDSLLTSVGYHAEGLGYIREAVDCANQQLATQHLVVEQIKDNGTEQNKALNLINEQQNQLVELEISQQETLAHYQQANVENHQRTQATLESHVETFPPLFSQVAGMQQSLTKDIIMLKNKE